jgi:DNA-binding response OmpR family regulator
LMTERRTGPLPLKQLKRKQRGNEMESPALTAILSRSARCTGRPVLLPPTAMTHSTVLHVLVVDDEPELRDVLQEYLRKQGCEVRCAANAEAARRELAAAPAHIALLDINMPGEDGLSLARWMRGAFPAMGIIMLTTAADTVDRVVGLEIGTDDYLPKPFDLRELLARIRAVWRRLSMVQQAVAAAAEPTGQTVAFGQCLLDLETRRLTGADGIEIPLTAAEFDLLALFARAPNRPLNRDQIMEQAHSRGWDVFDRSIDLRIMRLRRKIERNPDKPEIIKTVRGVGYVFVVERLGH